MAAEEKSDISNNSGKKGIRSLSITSYLSGLAGLSFAITLAMWTYLSLSVGDVNLPLLSTRSTLFFFLVLFILSAQFGITAWITGAIASRRAREGQRHGYRRWRMGMYIGISTLVLLILTFVIMVSYSIHILMYRSQFNPRML